MISDAIIEAAARNFFKTIFPNGAWDAASAPTRDTCRAGARALAAGLLATESPADPLPAGQVRREPDTSDVWHRIGKADEWFCAHPDIDIRLTDDDVRDWPVLVPEAALDEAREEAREAGFKAENKISAMLDDLNDLRGERDRLSAHVAELEATEPQSVDADALAKAINKAHDVWGGQVLADTIREHLPATTRPALPEGHVAVDLRGVPRPVLDAIADWADWDDEPFANAARAELARRAAENGVSS